MKSSEIFSLPVAEQEYDPANEQIMRRAVEQYVSELRNDVRANEEKKSGPGSNAMRRYQFMFMGGI